VRTKQGAQAGRLLIVGVQEVHRLAQGLEPLERGAREEQEALGVVGVARAGRRLGVDARPLEEAPLPGMSDQQHAQRARSVRKERGVQQLEAGAFATHPPRHLGTGEHFARPALGERQRAVGGHADRDAMTAARLLDRERADHVAEPADLDERRHLAGKVHHRQSGVAHVLRREWVNGVPGRRVSLRPRSP
jgi:hypothetical protein